MANLLLYETFPLECLVLGYDFFSFLLRELEASLSDSVGDMLVDGALDKVKEVKFGLSLFGLRG